MPSLHQQDEGRGNLVRGSLNGTVLMHFSRFVMMLLSVLLIVSLSFVTRVEGQYSISSYPNRYYAGTYIISFNSSIAVSLGTSPFSETNTNTSAAYLPLIKYSAMENNKVLIITGTSSSGDYLVFTSPTQFSVQYDIIIGFDTLTIGKRTVYIPSYGFQRFFTQRHVRKGKHNNLILMSGNVNQQVGGSQTINVGFTFNQTANVEFTPYTLSVLNYKVVEIEVPDDVVEVDNKHYVLFYLHIQCAESDLCRLVISLSNVEDDAPYVGTAFGIALSSLVVCLLLLVCVLIASFIHRRRRIDQIAAYIEPQTVQMGTIQYYSPTVTTLPPCAGNPPNLFLHANSGAQTGVTYYTAETGVVYQPTEVAISNQEMELGMKK